MDSSVSVERTATVQGETREVTAPKPSLASGLESWPPGEHAQSLAISGTRGRCPQLGQEPMEWVECVLPSHT